MARPRLTGARLAKAALVSALVFAAVGGCLAATDAALPTERPMPAILHVPAIRLGDRGSYNGSFHMDGPPRNITFPGLGTVPLRVPDGSHPFLDFSWSAGPLQPTSGGQRVATDQVDVTSHAWSYRVLTLNDKTNVTEGFSLVNGTEWIRSGTHEIVSTIGAMQWRNSADVGTGLVGGRMDSNFSVEYVEFAGDGKVDCLLGAGFDGRAIDTTQPLAPSRGVEPCFPFELRATGVEYVRGLPAVRFEGGTEDGSQHSALWLSEAAPYPLRLETVVRDPALGNTVRQQLDLVAYEPGTAPRPSGHVDATDQPIVLAPRRGVVGVDDSQVDVPFRLSEAYQVAVSDPNYPDLRDFVQAHPNAYVANAGLMTHEQDSQVTWTWQIGVTDGSEVLWLMVARVEQAPDGIRLPGQLSLATVQTSVQTTQAPPAYAYSLSGTASRFPKPDELPAELPTVASLANRWSFDRGESPALNWYAIDTLCFDDCRNSTRVGVGSVTQAEHTIFTNVQQGQLPLLSASSVALADVLSSDAEGHGLILQRIDGSAGVQTARLPLGADPPQENQLGGHGPALAAALRGTWFPTPAQAAGAGLLAVFVGALYWLWPAVKGAGLGLFSRLQKHDVEEHPQRQLLAQAIEANPGIHFSELRRLTGLANGAAVHHLQVLEKAGRVKGRRNLGYTCYFPGDAALVGSAAAAGATKAEGARLVLAALRAEPGLSNLELAHRTGLSVATTHHHVQRLTSAGLVLGVRDGRSIRLHARVAA